MASSSSSSGYGYHTSIASTSSSPPPMQQHTPSTSRVPASPPTPAPSPRPRVRTGLRSFPRSAMEEMTPDTSLDDGTGDLSLSSEYEDALSSSIGGGNSQSNWQLPLDPQALTRAATMLLPTLPSSARVTLLSDLLMLLSSQELAQISSFVSSKLRIDFLSALPIEVSLHILSFIDDPLTLARASQVSRFWRSLVNDEHTWEAMCLKYRYRYRRPSTVYPLRSSSSSSTGGSDADLLASLYRRYRQRGLDPSNARNELRTLHDLFLAKQHQQSSEGAGDGRVSTDSIPEMSSADLRFYEQLEQIVQEESRERYGVDSHQRIQQDIAAMSNARTPRLASSRNRTPVMAPSNVGSAAGPPPTGSLSSHIGWLSTGPPSASRFPRTPPANRSRLPPLTGIAARSAFEPHVAGSRAAHSTPSRSRPAITAHPASAAAAAAGGPLSSWTGGLGLPWGLSDLISLPSSLTGVGHGSASAATPVTRASALGLGLPTDASTSQHNRAATYAGTPQQHHNDRRFFSRDAATARDDPQSFSYKAHFKRNYLTESNWHRGGRLLTHHVSAENGSVCTCTAMDQRWLVIGMANGRIHVFDARTGLYERTLGGGGTDSGVWCLALVSKTKGVRKASTKGKGKATNVGGAGPSPKYYSRPSSQQGSGADEYVTAEHQIRLVDYDPRLAAAIEARSDGGKPKTPTSAGSPWFPLTRRAIQRGVGSARSAARAASSSVRGGGGSTRDGSTPTTASTGAEADLIEGYPRDMVEAGPEFIRQSILDAARNSSAQERARLESTVDEVIANLVRIRAEHGITGKRTIPRPARREPHDGDEAMRGGDVDGDGDAGVGSSSAHGVTPMDEDGDGLGDVVLQDEVQFPADAEAVSDFDLDLETDSSTSDDEQAEYEGFSMGIGGSANGQGTLCGSTRGYGNDSALLVSGGCDRDVKVWDLSTGELKHTMRGHASTVRCLRVLEGRPIAVSGGRDSTVRVWDISTGRLLRILAGHQNSVRCLEVAGNRVATGSYDCTCRLWDVDTGECLHVLRGHYNQIYCVAFDGNKVATGSLDSTVRVWSAETGEPLALLQGHTALVGNLQLSNNILISGGSDGRILVYSLLDMTLLYAICAHDNSVSCFQFDEHFIVTGGNDGAVRLWNLFDGSFIRELTRPMHSVWKLAFRDDKVLAMCKREDESLSMEVFCFRPIE